MNQQCILREAGNRVVDAISFSSTIYILTLTLYARACDTVLTGMCPRVGRQCATRRASVTPLLSHAEAKQSAMPVTYSRASDASHQRSVGPVPSSNIIFFMTVVRSHHKFVEYVDHDENV